MTISPSRGLAPRSTRSISPGRMPASIIELPLDIIGDSVYWLYAHLCDLTRQTARVPGGDRPDARRVCACAAGFRCGLCHTLSARQDLGRQGAPTPGRRRRPRCLGADGRQAALYSGLSEDESTANDARLTMRAEPTPNPLLD